MTPPDPATLAAIHADAFDAPWSAAEFAALLGQPGVGVVADSSGFLLFRVVADEAEVLTLAVVPAARRTGRGRRLVDQAAARVAAEGAVRLFLEVAEDNAAALGLYRVAGFLEVGRRRGYYARRDGAPADALILARVLNSPD